MAGDRLEIAIITTAAPEAPPPLRGPSPQAAPAVPRYEPPQAPAAPAPPAPAPTPPKPPKTPQQEAAARLAREDREQLVKQEMEKQRPTVEAVPTGLEAFQSKIAPVTEAMSALAPGVGQL